MVLVTANNFLKWLSRLIPIKQRDALTATWGNDSGSKESVNQQELVLLTLYLENLILRIGSLDSKRYTLSASQ